MQSGGRTSAATMTPMAIGRSKEEPSFFTSAGAKFTVILWAGKENPEFLTAVTTRSRDSRTPASGSPTMLKAGRPNRKSTSTQTGYPSTPWTAADNTRANIIGSAPVLHKNFISKEWKLQAGPVGVQIKLCLHRHGKDIVGTRDGFDPVKSSGRRCGHLVLFRKRRRQYSFHRLERKRQNE